MDAGSRKPSNVKALNAKPFLKWVGGKKQLLQEFDKRMPIHIKGERVIKRYVEPFVGGGAMFFFLKRNYRVEESFLFDVNPELTLSYQVVKRDCNDLIKVLMEMEEKHLNKDEDGRKENYYGMRDAYNLQMKDFDYERYSRDWVERAAYMIFLNKTCFNGLFRQNKKGEFNVPFGRYKNPSICNKENLIGVSKALEDTEILCSDFTGSGSYIEEGSFVYFDPPYRPLNSTSNFTAYSKNGFDDVDQVKLADFFERMDDRGAYLMLSNSDPKNENPNDKFFDRLYKSYKIDSVPAKRNINCDGSKRGNLNELIIMNYSLTS